MSIANRLGFYLSEHQIPFQVIPHFHSDNSVSTAVTANVPLNQIAKGVMLSDHEGRKLMAVLPANNKVTMSRVNEELLGSYHLIKENQVYELFKDCEHGAVPPVGIAYNMSMICDSLLDELDEVYIEAGDHENLLCIDKQGFEKLTASARHARFSREVIH
ncbi:aminoacyl-tRNA deacylase [Thalassotalea sp. ND16A]|uniref:aminoacyl-tRNA deacylase n=1 Tax=Thalassotalea sp. ND16A TaxID=1535422 RepID=UPI00051A638D|nr:YbaK/EbsC family protein [Thalassotalea sp. ND16A]KGJ99038.1 hypothetical protein ND16A_0426 [Thalassotalea sp. ND16A]